jgi:hypothetical protein
MSTKTDGLSWALILIALLLVPDAGCHRADRAPVSSAPTGLQTSVSVPTVSQTTVIQDAEKQMPQRSRTVISAQPVTVPSSKRTGSLNRVQAIQAATHFCRAIGKPVIGPGFAEPVADPRSFLPPTYWQPRWRVRLGTVEVEVSRPDGVICRYYDFGLSQQLANRQPAGTAISRTEALAKAATALTAAHIPGTLGPPEAQEANITSPPLRAGHIWTVDRQREAQGVPFQDQEVIVILQAETGAIQAMGVKFPSPPPDYVRPTQTQAQAVSAALTVLKKNSTDGAVFHSVGPVRLVWVTPRTYPVMPAVNGVMVRPSTPPAVAVLPPRLAWMCIFRDGGGAAAILPIDAVTGKVIRDSSGLADASMRHSPVQIVRPVSPPGRKRTDRTDNHR